MQSANGLAARGAVSLEAAVGRAGPAGHLNHDFPLSDRPRTVPYCNPYLSASGVHPHMTSSTEATSTPKVAVNDIGSEEAFLAA
ncbi:MAG TPA: hypothetical protein VEH05_13240, partial [Streptosporangiaceae bacterium]|nr:hypothetical protein [Streptosporangiaceae bacterium]